MLWLLMLNKTRFTHEWGFSECIISTNFTFSAQQERQNMAKREAKTKRVTNETNIELELNIDGSGEQNIKTGVGFFDHMLAAFVRHGLFDLRLYAMGDLDIDAHHTVEDCGIVLGVAFAKALGERRGINRFANNTLAMDEALVLVSIDISGRGGLYFDANLPHGAAGAFDFCLAKEFFTAFATNAGVTLHIRQIVGENPHHIIECMFKAVGRTLRAACEIDVRANNALPSTKGVL